MRIGLADVFEQAIAGGDVAEIVIDLSGLAFIDSAGLRAVIILERIAQARGLELVLVPPSGPLLDLLRITGLATRVRLASELDEAQAGEFAERIELDLPCDLTAPGIARAEVRAALQRTQSDGDPFTAVLLTSDLRSSPTRFVTRPTMVRGRSRSGSSAPTTGCRSKSSIRGPDSIPPTSAPSRPTSGAEG